jgi:sialic acid synthase SpsE
MLRRLELSEATHCALLARARERRILFLSTPFDEESADFLAELDVPAIKVPSGEVTNKPFLEHVGRLKRPVILSTGMSDLEEVRDAVRWLRVAGEERIVLLHCVSDYPADPADANLRAMNAMAEAFGLPVGFSDHTPGIDVSLAAAALGASVIEKHLTLDKSLPGPDHRASLEPDEFKRLVAGVRVVERSLGHGRKEPAPSEAGNRDVVRRSVAAAADLPAGAILKREHLTCLRPARGIPPSALEALLGHRLKRGLRRGELLQPGDAA